MDELEKQELVSWLKDRKSDMPISVISEEELFSMVNKELGLESSEAKDK